ncbi:hypothetical protein Tco_1226143 [Tanacetum coccineum]
MGDENPIRTLGDYSKPSHECYRNTIKLPVGNISLVNSFVPTHPDLLRKVHHHGIDLWLQVQIFYDLIDHTLKWTVDYATGGRLRKLSAKKAWATIEELARYEDEGWNDLVAPREGNLDYENHDIKQLLGVMECKVDTLMKEAISLMGRSESIFGMTSNIVYQLPLEPSQQEEFENLVMNFILDQEEKVKQLQEYMGVIGSDFATLFRALKEQDTSSRSGNDAHADDADIRPIYDEESMAEVQTTAEINIFATGQQHTEQPKFNIKERVRPAC